MQAAPDQDDGAAARAAAVSPAVAEITGRPAIDVWQFARNYAPAFRG